MGHTFCPAPTSPSKKSNAKPTPRSSGVPGNWASWGRSVDEKDSRNLKKICELNEDSRCLKAIREILEDEPPAGLVRTDSKRRKKVLELFSHTGKLSSRQLKQMLLSRRSSSPQPLTTYVAPRTTNDGKKYSQIAAQSMNFYGCGDPSVYYGQGYDQVDPALVKANGCGNPSVYQVNECRDIAGKQNPNGRPEKRRSALSTAEEVIEQNATATINPENHDEGQSERGPPGSPRKPFLAPISPTDNNEPYYLGITDDYLLPTVDSEELGHTTRPESLLPLPPILGTEANSNIGDSRSNTIPRLNLMGKVTQGQPESSTDSQTPNHRSYGPQTHRSSLRIVKRPPAARSRPRSPGVAAAVPHLPGITPQTPRNSTEETRKEIQISPRVNGRAQAPSLGSANDSIAEDGQSEASVGVPMEARSAEVVCPRHYNGDKQKFPKPGPAPTGALPSLPEGHDSRTAIVMLPSVGPGSATAVPSPAPSPTRALPRSPATKYRYRPLDNVVTEETAKLLKMQTRSRPKTQTPQSPWTEHSKRPNFEEPCVDALTPVATPLQSQKMTKAEWQEKRAQSRRELKLRDLNRLRSQNGLGDMAQATAGRVVADDLAHGRAETLSNVRESYGSPALLSSDQPQLPPTSDSTSRAPQRKSGPRPLSALSPILVVAEQEPTATPPALTAASKPLSNGKRSSRKRHTHKGSSSHPACPSPSLPSSDDEVTCRTQRNRIFEPHCHSHAQTASTHHPALPTQDLEAKFEARIAELEKKNALLLNAFIAVINTSAGYVPSSLSNGDRMSGQSGRTSSGVSGHRLSGQSGYRVGGLGGISEMYAPLGEVAGEPVRTMQGSGAENRKSNEQ